MAPSLFSLLQIKSIILKNRIVISPMCQYSAEDGFANDWHLVHLGARAIGGAALVIQEATAVSPEGRISPCDLGIWSDEHIEKYRQITAFILSQNAFPGIQLAHAGRKASITTPWQGNRKLTLDEKGWRTVAPSAIPYHDNEALPPVEMDKEDIDKVIEDLGKQHEGRGKRAIKYLRYMVRTVTSSISFYRRLSITVLMNTEAVLRTASA